MGGSVHHKHIESLVLNSEKTILIGIGLSILNNEPFRLEMMKKFANSRGVLEIFLADPYSIYTERRFIEEETGYDKPSIGKKGVLNKIKTLTRNWEKLNKPENINIKLFSHYLTFALFIIDKDYFFYPYGFAKTGNYSPVFHFSKLIKKHEKVIEFLDSQYFDVKSSSKDAVDYLDIKIDKNFLANKIFPVAIFFVPSSTTDIYRFGSAVIGYDIYKNESVRSLLSEDLVGGAKEYGFHLTICDVLYFQNSREIREIEEELEFFLEDYKSFYVEDLSLTYGFPNKSSISIRCLENSGILSSIHFELVNRIYKKSLGSNYSFNRAKLDRELPQIEKQKYYLDKYNAPYIIDEFKPHFTLCGNVKPNDKEKTMNKIAELFQDKVNSNKILVDALSILQYDKNTKLWYIKKTIKLKNE